MKLVIAEKPSLAREIAAAIGNPSARSGYIDAGEGVYVSWCVGHILEQVMPQGYDPSYEKWVLEHLPIVPETWKLQAKDSTASQLNVLRGLLKNAESVIHAGDPDREGQLIVDEVLDFCRYKGPVERLWVQDLTANGIRRAWDKKTDGSKHENLYQAALARQRADWLLGINLTRAYSIAWGKAGNRGALHVGRVQTPTLGLIVARDAEIENFQPKDYFSLSVQVSHQNGEFNASWQAPHDAAYLDAEGRLIDKEIASALAEKLQGSSGVISSLKVERKRQPQPLPFTLAGLQKLGSKFGMTPQKVLDVCQSLYERHKLLSYPRTDSPYLSLGDHQKAPGVIASVRKNVDGLLKIPDGLDESIKSHAFDDKKLGAHTGIIPTATLKSHEELSREEATIYKIVCRQYLAQFFPIREYDSTTLVIDVVEEKLKASGRQEIRQGWRVMFDGESEEDAESSLPLMSQNDAVQISSAKVESKKTTPPPRFDGSSLVDAMENIHRFVTKEEVKRRLKETDGLGTPATRGVTIENLEKREYVTEVKEGKRKVLVSTDKGRQLIRSIPNEISAPDLTAYFESLLKQIEEGSFSLAAFESQQAKFVTKLIDAVKSGAVTATMSKIEPPQSEDTGRKFTPRPTGRSSSKKTATKSSSPEAKKSTLDGPICPSCKAGALLVRKGTSKAGKPYEFYGCSKFPSCKHTSNSKP